MQLPLSSASSCSHGNLIFEQPWRTWEQRTCAPWKSLTATVDQSLNAHFCSWRADEMKGVQSCPRPAISNQPRSWKDWLVLWKLESSAVIEVAKTSPKASVSVTWFLRFYPTLSMFQLLPYTSMVISGYFRWSLITAAASSWDQTRTEPKRDLKCDTKPEAPWAVSSCASMQKPCEFETRHRTYCRFMMFLCHCCFWINSCSICCSFKCMFACSVWYLRTIEAQILKRSGVSHQRLRTEEAIWKHLKSLGLKILTWRLWAKLRPYSCMLDMIIEQIPYTNKLETWAPTCSNAGMTQLSRQKWALQSSRQLLGQRPAQAPHI